MTKEGAMNLIACIIVSVFLGCSLISAAAGLKYLFGAKDERDFPPPPAGALFHCPENKGDK